MSDISDESDAVTTISTRAALWKSFLTVSTVLPWGMIACISICMSAVAMGTGSTSSNAIIRLMSPVLPAILLWFAYSLGVTICTQRRGLGIIIGLILGWLLLSVWWYDAIPDVTPHLFSPKNDTELLKSVLAYYITGAGWLVASGILLRWLQIKTARFCQKTEKHA